MVLKKLSRRLRLPYHRWATLRQIEHFHAASRSLDEAVDMAMAFGKGSLLSFRMMQKRSEILRLAQAVAALKPKTVVEIGTAQGGTLFLWSQIASTRVISCDLEHPEAASSLYARFTPPGSSCSLITLTGDTHDPSFRHRLEGALQGDKIDFLFIDGDHSEAGVAQDYHDYAGLVRPGGIIAFHDIVEKQLIPTNQVYAFWSRLRQQGLEMEEFVDNPQQSGFGIGIVRVGLHQ